MAIVIRNNDGWHITQDANGKILKVKEITEAKDFGTLDRAVDFIQFNSGKTKKYYVYDTCTHRVCYGRKPRQQYKKVKRKHYSTQVRKLLYEKANGCCQLCGRKLLFKDASLDHIVALAQGGKDKCKLVVWSVIEQKHHIFQMNSLIECLTHFVIK